MSKQVLVNVSWTIPDGKLEAFLTIAREIVEVTQKEPGTLGFEWYMSGDGKRCQMIETYVDADALLAHLVDPAMQECAPKLMATASVSGVQVYGEPGPKARELLGHFAAEIFPHTLGLNR